MLRPDHIRLLPHLSPDSKGGGIHKQQPELIAGFAPLAVNADHGKKLRLPRANQVRPHTESGRILNLLYLRPTLCNGLVMQQASWVISIQTGQQIIRRIVR